MRVLNIRRTAVVVEPVSVLVAEVSPTTPNPCLKTLAYIAANESPSSCFGAHVERIGKVATVEIFRD